MHPAQWRRPDRSLEVISWEGRPSRVEGHDHLKLGETTEAFPILPLRVIRTVSAVCPECGGRLVPHGSCLACAVCGWGACG